MVKLKAVTIIETIVAMIIILIVFFTVGAVLLNIEKGMVSEKRIKANSIMNNYMDNFHAEVVPAESDIQISDFRVSLLIENYSKPGVALINCYVYDDRNNIMAEGKRIIIIKK